MENPNRKVVTVRTSTAEPLEFEEKTCFCHVTSLNGNAAIPQWCFINIAKVSLKFCANWNGN